MTAQTKAANKAKFEAGDVPTQADFADLIDSYQDVSAGLGAISALAQSDGDFIVSNGTTWVAEAGNTARTSLGVGTGDSPQFAGVNIGNASDTTLTRSAAGVLAVEGDAVVTATNAGIVRATASAPALIRGFANLSTYPGVTKGSLPGSTERTANGTALQAAFDWCDTNNKYGEMEPGDYQFIASSTQNSRNTGLHFKKGGAGLIGAGSHSAGTRLIQYATNHPVLTLGDVGATASDLTEGAQYQGFTLGHGSSQAGETSADGLLLGRIWRSNFDDFHISPFLGGGHPNVGVRVGLSSAQFFFSNVIGRMEVRGGQAHIFRSDANGTGNTWRSLYLGGGGFGNRVALSSAPMYVNSPEFGAINQLNIEWTNSSAQSAALDINNCDQFYADIIHFEGVRVNNFDGRCVMAAASRVHIASLKMLDTWIGTANTSGVPAIFRSFGNAVYKVGNCYLFWNGSGYNAEAVADRAFSLFREDTSQIGRSVNVDINNLAVLGNTAAFSFDTTLTGAAPGAAGAIYGAKKYTSSKTRSRTEGAIIEARNADLTVYGAHRSPQVRLKQALTADRKVILSNNMAASGIGNVPVRLAGDEVNAVRESGATGAFNWLIRDSADAVTIATLGTANTESSAILDTTGAWDAS
jgi:hypothetical protein